MKKGDKLLLGQKNYAELLVSIEDYKSDTDFTFWVINGAYEGFYKNGYIQIPHTGATIKYKILSDNILDMISGDYNNILNNFNNKVRRKQC